MKKAQIQNRPIDPLDLYLNARGFFLTANVISGQTHASIFFWPTMVNEAFALELYIKCLHRVRRRTVQGHNLRNLFGLLSKKDRRTLSKYLRERVTAHPQHLEFAEKGVPLDVDSVLMRASDMFVRGRYWHEGNLPSQDSLGYSSNAGVGSLNDSINRLLLELHPDWHVKLHAFRLKLPGIGMLPS